MRRTAVVPLILALSLTLLAGACAKKAEDDPLGKSTGFEVDDDLDDSIDGKIAPGTGLGGGDAPTSDEVVQAALEDVQSFWDRHYGDVYSGDYTPISGGFFAYGPNSKQPPCGDPAPAYDDIADNAFYCPAGDLIAWDNTQLVPNLYDQYGGFTLGIVFAHEFGHAIQDATRADITGPTILTELQADCFAGAWTADVAAGNSKYFELKLDDLDKAVGGFLDLRDSVGTDPSDAQAHGTAFDRIGSFTDGFQDGLGKCAEYPSMLANDSLVVTENKFQDEADYESGGNLNLDDPENQKAVLDDLQDFWTKTFADLGATYTPLAGVRSYTAADGAVTCGTDPLTEQQLSDTAFYCGDDDYVYIDDHLLAALNEVGDYAVISQLARQFAFGAQVQMGNTENSTVANLAADCYTGVYALTGFTGSRGEGLTLSPGDLDEAVVGFLLTSDTGDVATSGDITVGTAFQRFDAYRSGFLSGIDGLGAGINACNAYAEANG